MSNSKTSSYNSFDSSVNDTLLTDLRPKDFKESVNVIKEDITEDELKLIDDFNDKNEFKDQNLRDLSWKIFDDYFSGSNRLTQHHLDSYNNFISYTIPKIVKDYNPIIVKANYSSTLNKYMDEYHITFGDVYVGKPGIKETDGRTKMMYPIEARWRSLTYAADLYIDVYQKSIKHQDTSTSPPIIKEYPPMKKVSLRTIPIMVKSAYCPLSANTGRSQAELGECEYDKGGYFIVKGSEKVIICQERKCENKILAFAHNKTQNSYSHTVEINSIPTVRAFTRLISLKLYKKTGGGTIQVIVPRFKKDHPFPLFIVFRALGLTSDRDIMERILYNTKAPRNKKAFDVLKPSIDEAAGIQTQEMALLYMANYVSKLPEMKEGNETEEKFRQNYAAQLLKTELFPHVGEDFLKKTWFLGIMAKKLVDTFLGVKKHDDRDSFLNKRISSSGPLMEDLFRNNFNKMVKDIMIATEKDMRQGRTEEIHTTILKKIRASTIESSIRYSLGTGTWGMKSQSANAKKGIAQPLNRLSNSASVSHLRRVNAPQLGKGGRVTEPRKLHSTQWSRFCVIGDTRVLLPGGVTEYIRNLQDGDTVITVNPSTLQLETSEIYGWFKKQCSSLLEITSNFGYTISCTPDHPFLVKEGTENIWKTAGNLKQDDLVGYLFNFKVIFITINTIVQAPGDDVYDFTTDSKNHSFIANGFVTHNCPSETPDGHMVGIVKNMALMAVITIGSDPESILSILKEDIITGFKVKTNENNTKITPILDASPYQMDEQVRIFINGNLYGCTSTPADLVAKLRAFRRHGALDIYTSISWVIQEQEIRIHTEGGRCSRPLYVVRNNRLLITLKDFQDITHFEKGWNDLLLEGKIEYLDVQEEDTSMIATYYEDLLENKKDNLTFVNFTHCEIHPVMIFGAAACTIPFAENNQGIRIMYESAQKKQALSVYATNYRDRMDNPGQVLRFPQVPLITTKPSKYLNERELPSGQNAIVAIACFTG